MDNVAIVGTAYEAFGRGDIGGVLSLLDDSVVWSVPLTLPQGGTFTGSDGVTKFFEGLGAAWDPLSLEMIAMGAVSEDRVAAVVQGTGTLRGGGASGYGAVHVFTLRAGKVVRFDEYADVDAPLA